jgi:tetratricopeptide (TPR) repeat protein
MMSNSHMTLRFGQPSPPASGDPLERAMLALHQNRPNEAERIAGQMLKADPRNIRASYIFGCAVLMQGRAEEAIAPLETAARGRRDSEIETELAIALRLAGRPDDALRRLRRVVKRQPPFAAAFLELGSLLAANAQFDEAIAVLGRGVEIAPMIPKLWIELGYALMQRRDWAKAGAAFTHALAVAPDAADALFGMAKAHQEVGDNEIAVPYFRRYLIIQPKDAAAWLTFGHCLLELGELGEGYECFRAAARCDPKGYGRALSSIVASSHGRLWLKPSAAARYFAGASG